MREAVFNALHSLGVLEDAIVLDCFAGSGALGIEALSRGAAHVTFADIDRQPARDRGEPQLAGAVDQADVGPTAERVLADAAEAGRRFDLVLLDPPYGFDDWPGLVAAVRGGDRRRCGGGLESDRPVEVEAGTGLEVTRSRRYGSTVVTFARPSGVDT